MGRQYVRQSFASASCAAGDSSCAVNTTLQCVVVNATGQPVPPGVPPLAVREITSLSAGTPPSMEKVAQGQSLHHPAKYHGHVPLRKQIILSTKQKSLG